MTRASRLPILTFHALDDGTDLCGFPATAFRNGVAHLQRAGHHTVALADAVAMLQRGAPLPPRAFALTFDDGYASVYREAFPVLQELGVRATVFLTIGEAGAAATRAQLPTLNGRAMLHWSEIAEMQRAGIAFGAHSLTHPDLTRLPTEQVEAEIRLTRTIIEQRLGTGVAGFAYPYGRYDERCRRFAREHYAFACADTFGLAGPESDPWALERIETFYLRRRRQLSLVASPWFPAGVRAIALARRVRRIVR